MNDNVMQAKNGRWYCVNDAWVPSVTTILQVYPKGAGFDHWLGNSTSYEDAIAKRDAAGDRGTLVHEAIAALLDGQEVRFGEEDDSKLAKFVQGWVNWWESCKPDPMAVECFVAGEGYAGTFDFAGWIDGEPWLIDWKTSAGVYNSYHLQTSAYAAAFSEAEEVERWHRGILHLKTSTKKGWQLVEAPRSWVVDFGTFESCRSIYLYEFGTEPVPFDDQPDEEIIFKLEVSK